MRVFKFQTCALYALVSDATLFMKHKNPAAKKWKKNLILRQGISLLYLTTRKYQTTEKFWLFSYFNLHRIFLKGPLKRSSWQKFKKYYKIYEKITYLLQELDEQKISTWWTYVNKWKHNKSILKYLNSIKKFDLIDKKK